MRRLTHEWIECSKPGCRYHRGSSGIGVTLAEVFVQEGARVALLARRAGRLERLAVRLGSDYTLAIPTDVTDYISAARACERVMALREQAQM